MLADEDILERHVDLLAGVGAIGWALAAQTILPQLSGLCAPQLAGMFGLLALGRWYRKLRERKRQGNDDA